MVRTNASAILHPGVPFDAEPPGPLGEVLASLGSCVDGNDVAAVLLDRLPAMFASYNCGVIRWDSSGTSAHCAHVGIRDAAVYEWVQEWRSVDRVFSAVMREHRPVHNLIAYSEDAWVNAPIYLEFSRSIGARHYMSAPIHGGDGRITGLINFCRADGVRSFGPDDIVLASTIAGFASATLARIGHGEWGSHRDLARRELQVARLAASGLDNAAIAQNLGIARDTVKKTLGRVYEKLRVNGRAQMAAKMAARGWVVPVSPALGLEETPAR